MNASADAVGQAEIIAAAVASCPGVARLSSGASPVEVATYLPGRRVQGVRMGDGVVEIHVVARPGTVLPVLAESVRRAVTAVVPVPVVDVFVDDLELEPEIDAEEAPPEPAVMA